MNDKFMFIDSVCLKLELEINTQHDCLVEANIKYGDSSRFFLVLKSSTRFSHKKGLFSLISSARCSNFKNRDFRVQEFFALQSA